MSQDRHSVMEELYASTLKNVREGEIVKGSIVALTDKEAVVDIGFKSEGFVSLDEFVNVSDVLTGAF